MFPFWYAVVAPTLAAVDPRRVIEIGAHQGEHTALLIETLSADCELHVIDPAPLFDPEAHAARFGGTYVFHRATSAEVLTTIPPADVALVDGDHNWYAVQEELQLLDDAARAAGVPFPVVVIHDAGWPYARRDMYYAPERIPEAFRHPFAQRGIAPGQSDLLPEGGFNVGFNNATHEGGPRNGVLTAIEDHVAGSDRALQLFVVESPPGIALLVDRDGWGAHPPVAALLERLAAQERAGAFDPISLSATYQTATSS